MAFAIIPVLEELAPAAKFVSFAASYYSASYQAADGNYKSAGTTFAGVAAGTFVGAKYTKAFGAIGGLIGREAGPAADAVASKAGSQTGSNVAGAICP